MRKAKKKSIFPLLFFVLCISAVLLACLYFLTENGRDLSGKWTTKLDMTERSAVTALDWLQDIEGVCVSLEDMEAYMQDLHIPLSLTFEQTARFEGNFRCDILPEDYEACRQAAYEAFASVFRDLVAERLRMADCADDANAEAVEALVYETFGMSTVSYLMSFGPALLPSLEELQAQYGCEGAYAVTGDILDRQFSVDGSVVTRQERYIRKDSTLILCEETNSEPSGFLSDDYPLIYTLTEPENR